MIEEFCKKKKFLYFFIYEGKGANSLLREFEKELKDKKIIDQYRTISSIEEFIEIIFSQCRGQVIVFDEAQYMRSIYKPFFSLMQRKIDENQDYPAMIIFLGSVVGLVKRVFEDLKSPLFIAEGHALNLILHTKHCLVTFGVFLKDDKEKAFENCLIWFLFLL